MNQLIKTVEREFICQTLEVWDDFMGKHCLNQSIIDNEYSITWM